MVRGAGNSIERQDEQGLRAEAPAAILPTQPLSGSGSRPRPVRICYLIGSLERCGTSIHLLAFLRNLDRSRFTPWVVGLAEPGPIEEAIRALGIEVHSFSLRSIYTREFLRVLLWLARRIRRTRTDVVQSYLFLDNLAGPLAARLGGARLVITGRRTVDEWESRRHLRIYRFTNPLVDRIVVVSREVAESVYKWERVPKDKVTLIRNAQSKETLSLRGGPEDDAALAELDRRTAGGFVFGTVGNVRPIKGHDVLLRAFHKLVLRHPQCHLVVVGGYDTGPPDVVGMVKELGLRDSVHLMGLRSNVAGFVERFSTFVLPSLAEGMSNALLEALLLGKPAISSSFGLPRNREGEAVVLPVEPGNVDGLAEAMERVLTNRALREDLARKAAGYAEELMDEGRMVREYQKLYEEVLK